MGTGEVVDIGRAKYTDAEAVVAAKTVKLDDLATPDDNTDLNASASAHGLLLKLTASTTNYLRADGTWAAPAGGGDVTAATSITDDAIVRGNGGVKGVQGSLASVNDSGDVLCQRVVPSSHIEFNADALRIAARNLDTYYITLQARVSGTGLVEVARLAGAADPYFSAGGSQEFKFYYSGIADFGGRVTLAENAPITLDAALSADGKYSGITETGVAGTVLAFGDCCHFVAASSRWDKALASTATTSKGKLGMCVLAATAAADSTEVLLYGKIRADAKFPALPIGAPIFISAGTAGIISGTASSGTTDYVVRIIGYGNTADELFFCPDNTYIEIA